MTGAYSFVHGFDMTRARSVRGACVFVVCHNGQPFKPDGVALEFATHEACEKAADELAPIYGTARECFTTRRDWL